jgi:hypothetical protein
MTAPSFSSATNPFESVATTVKFSRGGTTGDRSPERLFDRRVAGEAVFRAFGLHVPGAEYRRRADDEGRK